MVTRSAWLEMHRSFVRAPSQGSVALTQEDNFKLVRAARLKPCPSETHVEPASLQPCAKELGLERAWFYDAFMSDVLCRKRSIGMIFLLCLLISIAAIAKRMAPKPVPPIVAGGIRYSAHGDGKDSYVVGTDQATGKQLWRVKVFHNRVHWWRGEEDNQWVFIRG